MLDENQTVETVLINGIQVKYRMPYGAGPHPVVLMFHGWTGDEDSMWVFAAKMPKDCLLIAPRGIFQSSIGGYGWHSEIASHWPAISDFKDSIQAIWRILKADQFSQSADFSRTRLLGFSQGAALAYAFSIRAAFRPQAVAGLSGFVPDGVERSQQGRPLSEIPFFVAHGKRDQIVPIERARAGVSMLQGLGARVFYCEDDAGHRLSVSCFRSLQDFFQNN